MQFFIAEKNALIRMCPGLHSWSNILLLVSIVICKIAFFFLETGAQRTGHFCAIRSLCMPKPVTFQFCRQDTSDPSTRWLGRGNPCSV